ncbi:MAG TPA: GWxTD domain-containing protein [Thermoanaerobaculia bacterium]|nr:GWxTD domain-containing protein [Thermoanaerobaculia bacterium]
MRIRFVAGVLLTLSLAAAAFGKLSKEYEDFAKGPTQHLLTRDEQKQWKAIATDDQAKAFIDLFWARRDPSPGTPANEYREGILRRIARADELYGTAKVKGSATDRGKVFVLMGSPTAMKRGGPESAGGVRAPNSTFGQETGLNATSVQGVAPSETWQYEQAKITEITFGQPLVQIAFSDQYASNVWKMERIVGTDYATIFDRVAKSYITQPGLTEVPTYAVGGGAVTAATTIATTAAATMTPAATATATSIKSDVLRQAVDEARAAKAASDTLFLSYGEFVTPEGEYFVPVQVYVPKSAGLAAGSQVTFFGAVYDESGRRITELEEPATLAASGDAAFYARSLTIPAGSYTGTFGLAKDGKPIAVVSQPMKLQGLDKSAPAVSSMMLSNNVYALTEAQKPTDPFAFGGIKVVPKGDRTFRPTDELWYFMEAQNPGIDVETNQPKMSMKVTIDGKAADGTEVNRSAPASLAEVQALKGVAGHYVLGQSMPLASFQPGSYTITVKVTDIALGKSYEFKEPFRVVQ